MGSGEMRLRSTASVELGIDDGKTAADEGWIQALHAREIAERCTAAGHGDVGGGQGVAAEQSAAARELEADAGGTDARVGLCVLDERAAP